MLLIYFAALLFASIARPAVALPALILPFRAATENWRISSMQLHMMTRYSGLPGDGEWSGGYSFPSTIDFDVKMPGQNVHCHTEFTNGTLPDDLAACSGEGDRVKFAMRPYDALGPRRAELSFVLQLFREGRGAGGQQTITGGEVAVTANNPTEPTSYLSCLLGAPYDGLRCNLCHPGSNYKLPEIVAYPLNLSNASTNLAAS
ncbi:hypothetical protein E8E13_009484 [Curvularia kusanoi]|uniref:Uncharacterized protein n=1 Tax=Curvularia kusanoi TaxID=90978 RepID=A0A9P4TMF9_CURKU|nr:hypothetical protein E8E13_009484 [Curvularia kusanoi]